MNVYALNRESDLSIYNLSLERADPCISLSLFNKTDCDDIFSIDQASRSRIELFLDSFSSLNESKRNSEIGRWQPTDCFRAVHVALERGSIGQAFWIAEKGHLLFPEDTQLSKAARILAPPRVEVIESPPSNSLAESHRWIEENREKYKGKWVAVLNGDLKAFGDTYADVVRQLDTLEGVLLTRVF